MWKNRGSKTFIKQDLIIKWGILSKSGSIWNSISFPSFYFVLGLKIVWPSQPDRCKTNINSNLVTCFPPLQSVSSFLSWVCIIFKRYFLLSWFAILITQILVSQHAFDHSDFGFSTCIWAVSYLMCISTVKILGYDGHTFLWLVQVPVTFRNIIFTLRRQMIFQFLNIKIFHTTIEVLRVWLTNKFLFIC